MPLALGPTKAEKTAAAAAVAAEKAAAAALHASEIEKLYVDPSCSATRNRNMRLRASEAENAANLLNKGKDAAPEASEKPLTQDLLIVF